MADNAEITPGSGLKVATDEVTHSGDTAHIQIFELGGVTGSEGSKTLSKIGGDATNGLDVDVTRIPDGANVTLGAKADAKSTATDTTPISAISIFKQISASVQAIASSIAGTLTVAAHALTAGEAHIGEVGGRSLRVTVEKTRPADTNVYAANDVIAESASAGTLWEFTVGRTATGSGEIFEFILQTDDPTDLTRFELDLYDDTITAINDNAEATKLYTNAAKRIATVVFPTLIKPTTNSTIAEATAYQYVPFKCVGNSKIYGVLRRLDADTPVSGSKWSITLVGRQD